MGNVTRDEHMDGGGKKIRIFFFFLCVSFLIHAKIFTASRLNAVKFASGDIFGSLTFHDQSVLSLRWEIHTNKEILVFLFLLTQVKSLKKIYKINLPTKKKNKEIKRIPAIHNYMANINSAI